MMTEPTVRSGELFIEQIPAQNGDHVGSRLTHVPSGKTSECCMYADYKENASAALRELLTRLRLNE